MDDKVFKNNSEHNHEDLTDDVSTKIEVSMALRKIAKSQPDEKPYHLISETLENYPDQFYDIDVYNFRKKIYRRRRALFKRLPKSKVL